MVENCYSTWLGWRVASGTGKVCDRLSREALLACSLHVFAPLGYRAQPYPRSWWPDFWPCELNRVTGCSWPVDTLAVDCIQHTHFQRRVCRVAQTLFIIFQFACIYRPAFQYWSLLFILFPFLEWNSLAIHSLRPSACNAQVRVFVTSLAKH